MIPASPPSILHHWPTPPPLSQPSPSARLLFFLSYLGGSSRMWVVTENDVGGENEVQLINGFGGNEGRLSFEVWKNACGCGPGSEWAVANKVDIEALKKTNDKPGSEWAVANKLKEYIDDTEDFINIQLDTVRNQLVQFELLLTTATFVVAIFGVVAGIFGMNFEISLFQNPLAFKWVLVLAGVSGVILFGTFLWFFKYRRLMSL